MQQARRSCGAGIEFVVEPCMKERSERSKKRDLSVVERGMHAECNIRRSRVKQVFDSDMARTDMVRIEAMYLEFHYQY